MNMGGMKAKYASLNVKIKMGNKTVSGLVDSGAEVTVLNTDLAQTLGIQTSSLPKISLSNAETGSNMTGYELKNFSFQIGSKTYKWDVYIAPIRTKFILGFDFAHHHGAILDYSTPCLVLHGEKHPAVLETCSQPYSLCRVQLAESMTLPPLSVSEIPVRIKNPDSNKIYVIEPLPATRNVLFAAACVRGEEESSVRVVNLENRKVKLHKKHLVGFAVETDESDLSYGGSEHETRDEASLPVLTLGQEMHIMHESYRQARQQQAVERGVRTVKADDSEKELPDQVQVPTHLKDLFERSCKNLDRQQRVELAQVLVDYQDVFSKDDSDLGYYTGIKHRINTGDAAPIRQPLRRTPHGLEHVEDELVDKMLGAGVITESNSQWASPVVIVRKRDGKHRFCIDYRKLNKVTVRDSYPLPNIDHCLGVLGGAKFFHTLDMNSGYWQVAVDERDQEKTAFRCRKGLFHYLTLPFGLTNAPATFERIMECVLRGLQWVTCLCFLDDVIIMAGSFRQAITRLRDVLNRFREANLKLKPKKCKLMQTETLFLGFMVSEEGIRVNPELVKDILEWPTPRGVKDVQSFLGTTGYFRKWIANYAGLASPLYELTKKKAAWKWEESQEDAFNALKNCLVNPPVLAYPIPGGRFILDCDASSIAVGCVLLQEQPDADGKIIERVIGYSSFHLDRAQRRYCATRLELLALIRGCRAYRHFLLGQPFLVRTDHSSLVWLLRFRNAEGQLARFIEELSSYSMTIRHRSGRLHTAPDGLSRRAPAFEVCDCYTAGMKLESLPCGGCGYCKRAFENWDQFAEEVDDVVPLTLKEGASVSAVTRGPSASDTQPFWVGAYTLGEMRDRQLKDAAIGRVLRLKEGGANLSLDEMALEGREVKSYLLNWSQLVLKEGVLYLAWIDSVDSSRLKLVVPRELRDEVIHGCHDGRLSGHMGQQKTLQLVKGRFHWYGMDSDVELYVLACDTCQVSKKPNRRARAPLVRYHAGSFGEKLHMDILGPFTKSEHGSKYVLIMVDNFTKYVEACALPDQTAYLVARTFVDAWVAKFGVPMSIVTDQGSNFCSGLMEEVCRLLECAKLRTTGYHPSANSQVERYCGIITRMIRCYVAKSHKDWDEALPLLTAAIRSTPNRSTGLTPNMMVYGMELPKPIDVIMGTVDGPQKAEAAPYVKLLRERLNQVHEVARENLRESQRRNKRDYDTKVHMRRYSRGDLVYVTNMKTRKGYSKKLDPIWQGPWIVLRKVGDNEVLYEIENRKRRIIIHHDRLKRYHSVPPLWMKRLRGRVLHTDYGSSPFQAASDKVRQDLINDSEVQDLGLSDLFSGAMQDHRGAEASEGTGERQASSTTRTGRRVRAPRDPCFIYEPYFM